MSTGDIFFGWMSVSRKAGARHLEKFYREWEEFSSPNFSINRQAASFAPKPKARAPARANMATTPENRMLI